MTRRLLAVLLSGVLIVGGLGAAGLVASVFSALPAKAQTDHPGATGGVIPANPNIVDPRGDANAGVLPVSFNGADVLAAWFTHDATNLYVHIQTTNNARVEATTFQTNVGPTAGLDCVQLRMTTEGELNESFSAINVAGECGDVPTTEFGPLLEEEGPDGTSILTGTYPREGLEVLAEDALLAEPHIFVGMWGHRNPVAGGSRIGNIDDTDIGIDYEIVSAGPLCGKIRNRQRRQRCLRQREGQQQEEGEDEEEQQEENGDQTRKKQPGRCPAYQPGEMGAEVEEETTIVTDEATEEEPIEMEFDFAPAAGDDAVDTTDHVFHNVQIDSEENEVGFWAKLATPPLEDPDLYVYWDTGNEAARAAGFNPLLVAGPVPFFDGTGNGGHSGFDYEQIDGIGTADCTGYTLDLVNWLGRGGTYTLTLWLGDIENEAKPRDG